MVLDGAIELETARVYASIARTVSQSMSTEVQRARISHERPDLEFGDGDVQDGDVENRKANT